MGRFVFYHSVCYLGDIEPNSHHTLTSATAEPRGRRNAPSSLRFGFAKTNPWLEPQFYTQVLRYILPRLYLLLPFRTATTAVYPFLAASETTISDTATSLTAMSTLPTMMSDGKRTRAVWRPGDGDGDTTQHIIERTKNTLHGHPTWKLFINDIPEPIVRGGPGEPPRYVYLDDASCYTVWKSKAYTNEELRAYYTFDFDHQGNIRAGRSNRGRPAWADSDECVIAKGALRGKNKWYEFSGEPDKTEYQPIRPFKKSQIQLQVEGERAVLAGQNVEDPIAKANDINRTPLTPREARLGKVSNLRLSPPYFGLTKNSTQKRKSDQLGDSSSPKGHSPGYIRHKRTKLPEPRNEIPATLSSQQTGESATEIPNDQEGKDQTAFKVSKTVSVPKDNESSDEEQEFLASKLLQGLLLFCTNVIHIRHYEYLQETQAGLSTDDAKAGEFARNHA